MHTKLVCTLDESTMENKMKKVGIIALSTENNGGVYRYILSMLDALAQDDSYKYVVFCDLGDKRFSNNRMFEVREVRPCTNSVVRILRSLPLMGASFFFARDEMKLYDDMDIFICPTVSAYPHFFLHKPFILTLHDMQERYYPDFFSVLQRVFRRVKNKRLTKEASKIICESIFVKNDIKRFLDVEESKISTIPAPASREFIDFIFNEDVAESIRAKYSLPSKYLFYPAQCWPHKNHKKLLDAFRILTKAYPELHLIFTGSQQNNYDTVMQYIAELSLSDKVIHLGFVDYEDIPYLYTLSKMLVMPTLFESISIPIYEAFSLSVPVCTSNVVALPEQVGNAALTFDPNDPEDIAEKISLLLSSKNVAQEKVLLGLERIKELDHIKYKEKLVNLLNDVSHKPCVSI